MVLFAEHRCASSKMLLRCYIEKLLCFQGTYQDYISADEEVKQLLVDIGKLVEENSEETKVQNIWYCKICQHDAH